MDCICGENIRLVKTKYGWVWVHDANSATLCPDGGGSAVVDEARSG